MAPPPLDPGGGAPAPTALADDVGTLRRALDRFRILIAVLALGLLGVAFVGGFDLTARELGIASLPNVFAALLAFVAITGFYRFAGISQTDQTARLLDKQRALIADDLSARTSQPQGAVVEFHPVWVEISTESWSAFLGGAQRVDVVMNWSDSLFESRSVAFRAAAEAGATFNLWLPDPDVTAGASLSADARRRMEALGTAYGLNYQMVRFNIANSVTKLIEIGADKDKITVRLMRRLAYPVVRVDDRRLMLSNFDQFRVDHPRASAFVVDLTADPAVEAYWRGQFTQFEAVEVTPTQTMIDFRNELSANGHQ